MKRLNVSASFDTSGIEGLKPGPLKSAMVRALRKAGVTALRDMRAEASKRIRERKRIKARYIARAISLKRAKGSDLGSMEWRVDVSGEPVPLIAYPHRAVKGRRGKRGIGPRSQGGVVVEVNRGKSTLVKGAFVATMKSGHEGIFRRKGSERLPIEELRGSRPVDALLHEGEAAAVARRGGQSFEATFTRLFPLEIEKGKGK